MQSMKPHDLNRLILEKTVPSMRYDGTESFKAWKERGLNKLNELLGLPFSMCEDCFTVEYDLKREGFTEIRFHFQSEEGYFVPCHLWIPEGVKGPIPLVICLQGHSKGMHISLGRPKYPGDEDTIKSGDRDFAVRVIKEGYCALSIEQRNFGESGGTEAGPNCTDSSMTALLMGRTTVGERVWDVQRAIDVILKYFPDLDGQNIVCMGNSGGGTTTFYAGCLEPRIKYVMPSCAVCTYEHSIAAMRHCACNYVPGIRKFFEMGDLAGLIAPRVLVIVAGKEDSIFPYEGVKKTYDPAKSLYRAAGAEDRCVLVTGDGGHRFYADAAWSVMNTFIYKEKSFDSTF